MNVLVISHMYPNPANPMAGIFVHNQIKAMKEEGIECRIISPIPHFPFYPKWSGYRKFPQTAMMDGIPIHYVPTLMFPGGLFFSAYGYFYYKALAGEIAEIREHFPFDIIHCHTIFPDGYAGAKLKQSFSIPLVTTIHGSDIRLYPYRSTRVYRRTEQALRMNDHIITVSEQLKWDTQKIVPGVEATTIYNGFDPQRFYPFCQKEARQKLGVPEGVKSILFVGNLYKVKGLGDLLRAFSQVAEQHPEVCLYLVGDGPLRGELKQQARESGVEEQIHFVGRKPHEEIPVWINSSDVVVLSSLSEGMPSIILEAMGCGKPVVATDVGGISEILQHRRTGFLVKPGEPKELARYLSILLTENEGLACDMGERAFTESGAVTWKRNAERMRALYEGILDEKRPDFL
ncbi:glycosyltransferase family 4 protein [Salinithrix halophila]|uniref:Glycosyltransferase family 4 protein n=1 Tax=Salinithrix halophila TaxID=1485204 RepID=A0ABV8JJ72_9BACL